MTMYMSIIDPRIGIRWVSAGHDPAIMFDPSTNEFEEIEGGELPLGVLNDTEYVERLYAPLRPEQILVIGTDGVWEMPNVDSDQFGKQRLRDTVRRSATGTAAEIVQAILKELTAFRGECRPMDDVTFVIVKVSGGPNRKSELPPI